MGENENKKPWLGSTYTHSHSLSMETIPTLLKLFYKIHKVECQPKKMNEI